MILMIGYQSELRLYQYEYILIMYLYILILDTGTAFFGLFCAIYYIYIIYYI